MQDTHRKDIMVMLYEGG